MKILRLDNLVKEGEAELDVDLCDDVGIKVEVDGCTVPDNAACYSIEYTVEAEQRRLPHISQPLHGQYSIVSTCLPRVDCFVTKIYEVGR
jgi:hypothetical protein